MKQNCLFMLAGFGLALTVLLFFERTNIYYYVLGVFWFLSAAVFLVCLIKERRNFTHLIRVCRENSLKLFCKTFDNSPDLIYYKDRNGKYLTCNRSFARAHGFCSDADVIGKEDTDLYDKVMAGELKHLDERVLASGAAVRYLKSSTGQAGRIFIHEVVKTPVWVSGKITGIAGIVRDVTEQHKLQEYLILKQAQLSSFLNNTSLFIFMLDPDGKILLGNDKFNELIGESDRTYLGKTLKDTVLAKYSETLSSGLESVVYDKEIKTNNVLIELNGVKNWLRVVKSPVFDKNEKVIGASCVMRNIDEEVQLKIRRDTFLATVSHDLKTPMVAQIRALDLVLNGAFGKLSEEQGDIVGQIWNSAKQLYQMVTNLLNTYKNEDGIVRLQFSNLHMVNLAQEVGQELYLLAKDRNLKIEFVDKPVDDVIVADEQEIRRVVINLLSNAISYADTGTTVCVSMYNNGQEYSLEVVNKSRYIPKEKLDTLFDKYVSVSNKVKRIGTGLGLYSSKQIITAHKGYMLAKSSKNDTNMFGFVIPVSPEQQVNTDRPEIIKNH